MKIATLGNYGNCINAEFDLSACCRKDVKSFSWKDVNRKGTFDALILFMWTKEKTRNYSLYSQVFTARLDKVI